MLPFSIVDNSFKNTYGEVLDGTSYSIQQKLIIKRRYVAIVVSAQSQYTYMRFLYYLFTILIGVCGLLVTSFASFERIGLNITGSQVSSAFMWVIWALGIIIALCGNLLHVLNIPKKYVINRVILAKLQSEGWLFISGTGRYATIYNLDDRFKTFCTRVEKIKIKAIESMPELGGSSEANDILSSGFDDSARDMEPGIESEPELKSSRKSKFILPLKRMAARKGLHRSYTYDTPRHAQGSPKGSSKSNTRAASNTPANTPKGTPRTTPVPSINIVDMSAHDSQKELPKDLPTDNIGDIDDSVIIDMSVKQHPAIVRVKKDLSDTR